MKVSEETPKHKGPTSLLKASMIGVGSLIFLCVALAAILSATPKTGSTPVVAQPAASKEPTATPTAKPLTQTPIPKVPTATVSPQQQIEKIAKDSFRERYIETVYIPSENAVRIDYFIGDTGSAQAARIYATDFARFIPRLFKESTVNKIGLIGMLNFVDVYGKETRENALRAWVTRPTADKIVWNTFNQRNLGKVLVGTGDSFSTHTAMRTAWAQYQAGE